MTALPEAVLVWEERCRESVGPRRPRQRRERSKGDRPADHGSAPREVFATQTVIALFVLLNAMTAGEQPSILRDTESKTSIGLAHRRV